MFESVFMGDWITVNFAILYALVAYIIYMLVVRGVATAKDIRNMGSVILFMLKIFNDLDLITKDTYRRLFEQMIEQGLLFKQVKIDTVFKLITEHLMAEYVEEKKDEIKKKFDEFRRKIVEDVGETVSEGSAVSAEAEAVKAAEAAEAS